ncbi:hypothetical protein Btru_026888 [Bulinus truncatus]|nr:hypothetical protein Btru_026888 [Bulinus truncatus]
MNKGHYKRSIVVYGINEGHYKRSIVVYGMKEGHYKRSIVVYGMNEGHYKRFIVVYGINEGHYKRSIVVYGMNEGHYKRAIVVYGMNEDHYKRSIVVYVMNEGHYKRSIVVYGMNEGHYKRSIVVYGMKEGHYKRSIVVYGMNEGHYKRSIVVYGMNEDHYKRSKVVYGMNEVKCKQTRVNKILIQDFKISEVYHNLPPFLSTMSYLMLYPHILPVAGSLRCRLFCAVRNLSTTSPGGCCWYHRRESFIDTDVSSTYSRTQASGVCRNVLSVDLAQMQKSDRAKLIASNPEQVNLMHIQIPDKSKNLNNWNISFYTNLNVLQHLKDPPGQFKGKCIRGLHYSTRSYESIKSGPLDPYVSLKDSLGLTYISDLNPQDAETIKTMAYEELKKFLTDNNIKFTKHASKTKTSDHGVFGTSVEVLVQKDIKKDRLTTSMKVPAVFMMMLKYIEVNGLGTEGIFKLPGAPDKVKNLRIDLEEKFYKDPKYSLYDIDGLNVHDVTLALNEFMRELPTTIVSNEKLNTLEIFPGIFDLPFKEHIKATNLFVLSMKEEYRDTLEAFLRLMTAIIGRSSANKMDDDKLAAILTPSIFGLQKLSEVEKTQVQEYQRLLKIYFLFRVLATYNKKLYVVPPNFLSAIRQLYISGAPKKPKSKFLAKLLGKKDGDVPIVAPPPERLMNLTKVLIRVNASDRQKEPTLIKITETTTAKDVLKNFGEELKNLKHERKLMQEDRGVLDSDRPIDYLFEIGGNIVVVDATHDDYMNHRQRLCKVVVDATHDDYMNHWQRLCKVVVDATHDDYMNHRQRLCKVVVDATHDDYMNHRQRLCKVVVDATHDDYMNHRQRLCKVVFDATHDDYMNHRQRLCKVVVDATHDD